MLRIFCVFFIWGISQSLAVISNAQQDLAIKPIVYKQPSQHYLPTNLQQQVPTTTTTNEPQYQPPSSQYQPPFVQANLSPSKYNGPAHQYLPTTGKKEEVVHHSNLNQHYQPPSSDVQNSFATNYKGPSQSPTTDIAQQNYLQPNYNGPSSSVKDEVKTTSRPNTQNNLNQYPATSIQNSLPSNYNGPAQIPNTPTGHQNTQQSALQNSSPSNYNGLAPPSSKIEELNYPPRPLVQQNQYQPSVIHNSSPPNYNEPHLKPNTPATQQNTVHQYQPSTQQQFTQNSLTSNYNGPSSIKEGEATTTSGSNTLHNTLNQYQTSFNQNPASINYNGPSHQYTSSTKKEEQSTTPRTNQLKPGYQYFPATTETIPVSSVPYKPQSEHFNNNKQHWNPIQEQQSRPQETFTPSHTPSNVQPPIELHHGYRYVEPAQKVNSSNFQTVNGVIYNELGLGQNETLYTTQKPQIFVPQNPSTGRTEIETHQGYVYGPPHYPNTTVLRPVEEELPSYNHYQTNHRFGTEIHHNNTNREQLAQQESKFQISTSAQEQQLPQYQNHRYPLQAEHVPVTGSSGNNRGTTQEQQAAYPNHRYPNSNVQQSYPALQTAKVPLTQSNSNNRGTTHQYPSENINNRPTLATSSHSQTENKSPSNTKPSYQNAINNRNPPTSSQVGESSNKFHLLSNSNNIASPQQSNSNRYTTEITQQMATQIYPNLNIPNPISTTSPGSNQHYLTTPQHYVEDAPPARPLKETSYNNQQTNRKQQPSISSSYPSNQNPHGPQSRPTNYGTFDRAPPTEGSYNKQQSQAPTNQFQGSQNQQSSAATTYPSPSTADYHNNKPTQTNQNQQSSSVSSYPANQNQHAPQPRPSNYGTFDRAPPTEASYNNQQSQTQTQASQNQQSSAAATYPSHQNPHNTYGNLNQNPNVQAVSNQYSSQQNLPTRPTNFESSNNGHSTIASSNTITNGQAPENPISSSYPSNYHHQQTFQATQNSPSPNNQAQAQSIQFGTAGPQYSANQNQQNSGKLPSTAQTDSNSYYNNPQQSYNTPHTSIASLNRPNIPTETNQAYLITSPGQSQQQNTLTKPTQKPSLNLLQNIPTADNHYYYTKPQQIQSDRTPQATTSVQTESNRFPQQVAQPTQPLKILPPQTANLPTSPLDIPSSLLTSQYKEEPQANRFFYTPQKTSQQTPQTISSSSNHINSRPKPSSSSALIDTARYTPQNQQYFLGKPTQTSKVSSTNTVSNFFGQAGAVSSSTIDNNNNIISPTSQQYSPGNLMDNTNYLQMQSHSYEMPYYYTMLAQQKQQQPQPQKPLVFDQTKPTVASVEPVRLPHIIYGSPVSEASNTYLPPSLIMQPPYYRK